MEAFVRDRGRRLAENFVLLNRSHKFQQGVQHRLAAFYYAQLDRPVPVDAVREQELAIKSKVGMFSGLRGLGMLSLATRLTLENDARLFDRTETLYRRLRETFSFSDQLAAAALELAKHADDQSMDDALARTVALHKGLKQTHRLRMGANELVPVVRLALTDESVENLIAQVNLCHEALRTQFPGGYWLMGTALYLVLAGDPAKGLQKTADLARKFKEYGIRMNGRSDLPAIVILSASDKEAHALIGEVSALYEMLKKEKGFSGWYAQRNEIMNYAAALVALEGMHLAGVANQTAYITALSTAIAVAAAQSSAGS